MILKPLHANNDQSEKRGPSFQCQGRERAKVVLKITQRLSEFSVLIWATQSREHNQTNFCGNASGNNALKAQNKLLDPQCLKQSLFSSLRFLIVSKFLIKTY